MTPIEKCMEIIITLNRLISLHHSEVHPVDNQIDP